jgi:hypothetical protein
MDPLRYRRDLINHKKLMTFRENNASWICRRHSLTLAIVTSPERSEPNITINVIYDASLFLSCIVSIVLIYKIEIKLSNDTLTNTENIEIVHNLQKTYICMLVQADV